VEYGVDVSEVNYHGYDPCYYADFGNHRDCAGYLCLIKTALAVIAELLRAAVTAKPRCTPWQLLG
jgi:hypothetical protein